jgi:AcrR family transcriptional regulator
MKRMSLPAVPVEKDRAGASPVARRKRALAAARAIAAEGGYEAVTMRYVAQRSGVSRATLYRYFSSKDQLLVEVSLDLNASLVQDLKIHPPAGDTLAERLTDTFARALEPLAREPKLLAATLRAFFADDPAVNALGPEVRAYGGTFVSAGAGAAELPGGSEIARVLGPLSLVLLIRIGSEHCTFDEAVEEIRCAVRLLLRD